MVTGPTVSCPRRPGSGFTDQPWRHGPGLSSRRPQLTSEGAGGVLLPLPDMSKWVGVQSPSFLHHPHFMNTVPVPE